MTNAHPAGESPLKVRGRWWWIAEVPYWTRRSIRKTACRLVGHRESLREIGFGFGNLDYFCARCGAFIRSVPVDELSTEERNAVSAIGGWRVGTEVEESDL